MTEDPTTEELRLDQLRREEAERRAAGLLDEEAAAPGGLGESEDAEDE